ncbi:MAG: AraC family transcriptional regulator [Clostridia bacterium]|nr:AraC family transcriptional regulator [Clostridia bacterium]
MLHQIITTSSNCGPIRPVLFGWHDCPPGHRHNCSLIRSFWLIHFVVRGFGNFYFKGQEYRLGPGEMFIIPPKQEHLYVADNEEPWEYIFIGLTIQDGQIPPFLYEPVIRCPEAHPIFEEMKRGNEFQEGRGAFFTARFWDMISVLQEKNTPQKDAIDYALELIRAHYAAGLTVQQLADALHLSRGHFTLLFKKKTGIPPQQYLIELRMEEAAKLLQKEGLSPSAAAFSVGYADIYQFSKAFKKHFGVSPREYRKNG